MIDLLFVGTYTPKVTVDLQWCLPRKAFCAAALQKNLGKLKTN